MIKITLVNDEGREELDKDVIQAINALNRIHVDINRGFSGFVSEDGVTVTIGDHHQ